MAAPNHQQFFQQTQQQQQYQQYQQQQQYLQQQQHHAQASMDPSANSVILVTAGYDHTIRFWEALSGVCYRTVQHPDAQVNCLAITPDKQYIAAGGNPHIRMYDIASHNHNPITSFDGHTGNVTAVGFRADGKWMYSGSEDTTIKIWDMRTPGCQREYVAGSAVNCVTLHPNQTELISGDQSGRIKIWELRTNKCAEDLIPEPDVPIRSLTIAPDASQLVAGNNNGNCYVWKLQHHANEPTTATPIKHLAAHSSHVLKCLISPDARLLATCSSELESSVKIWNIQANYSLFKTLSGHQRWVWDCAFSSDSAYLVTASSDQIARLWDIAQGESIKQFTGHLKAITCLALND
ncbi:transducin family protein/WD-40 repeat family protein [Capsaspora owczarzaki ATCC 30864]|uniref:Protein LST8 homolog n=1 Tax=Capsaspora owczarzaki (strain ATCC 30864) TaxID=595528 RepID=A0A0D2VRC1_CAPO3|nr:transducin family protein/WD-40 repeat family protein [Capsaspora owczarzaki ATCC 30864]KJE93402.1 transducin family protein/WD-40 repeat family protein [Capsaspora owczarzaki ATCC 30864]|eukprot:XP_004348021.1 transducin family protein/WD-40 repeat family protein [Capsaspora owczarzaki ATCC 30864]